MNKIINGDALQVLSAIDNNSIDLVLTDPPYFLDKMDNGWDEKKVASTKYHHVIKSLPAGMKFDREQGKNFYEWYSKISKHILRVLKPGGFFFSFSSPRLYHRMVSAIDDAGLLIRDCFIWLYTQNQPKAIWFAVIISVYLTAVPLDLTGGGIVYATEKPQFSEDEILYELNSERNLIHYTRLNGLLIDILRERKRIFAKNEGAKENDIFINAEELINEASILASQERYDESFRLLENVFNLIK